MGARVHAVVWLTVSLPFCATAQQAVDVNLVPNGGFEQELAAHDTDGKPLKWGTHTGKGEVDFAIVGQDAHSGRNCAHIKAHKPNPSGYWITPRIPVEGGRKYRLKVWYRSRDVEPSARGVVLSLNYRRADDSATHWLAEFAEPFTNPWTEVVVESYAPADAVYLNIVLGLADSAGELWLDDVQFVNTGEARKDLEPTDAITARPFPQTWLPDKSIGLIQGQTHGILFLLQNATQRQVAQPRIGLLLPDGVSVVGGDCRITPPLQGDAVTHDGKTFQRWLCPIEDNRHLCERFDYYRGSLVCLRATLPPGSYEGFYFFSSAEEAQDPQRVAIQVLPPLPEPPDLGRYHVGLLLTDAYRAGGAALEGIAELYARTGMNVCTFGVNPDPAAFGRYLKQRGVVRHFLLPGTGVVYNCAYGNRDTSIAIVDRDGQPNLGGLCPTYTAERGEHFESKPLEEIIGKWVRADAVDGFTINWEPPGAFKLDKYCFCPRCLAAFAEFAGIAGGQLDAAGILAGHKLEWARFRAQLEGRIAKAYYDKAKELQREVGRRIMFIPWTGTGQFGVANPTQAEIDDLILSGDVEHPVYYHKWIDAYGPFAYAYYDVIAERWRGRHSVTLKHARAAVDFASAQAPDAPKPVWLGIQGIQKGSRTTLCWGTSPAQMELEIVCSLAQGCRGVYVYTGRGMDGHFYAAVGRAVRRAALLERYADHEPVTGVELASGVIDAERMASFAYAKFFSSGESHLLILAGLDAKRTFPFVVRLPGLAQGSYRVRDPVGERQLGGQETWTGAQLQRGVEIELGPGALYTVVVERQ